MENSLAHSIQEIADKLTNADTTVATLAQLLGNVAQKYTGSGYYLTPVEPRFQSVWVGIATGVQGRENVTDVEVELAAVALLHVSDLDDLFGRHAQVPADPSGPLHRIRYVFENSGKPFKSTIYVTLGKPDEPGALAERISIRRDAN